jgi:error-prone DNA polymerase
VSSYIELHAHSAYSFLDGASQPEELAARAAELGYPALALTDHDGLYGSLEFAYAAKHFGVRAITGAEVTLTGGAHVTILVEETQGYANLCRLLTVRPRPLLRRAAATVRARRCTAEREAP